MFPAKFHFQRSRTPAFCTFLESNCLFCIFFSNPTLMLVFFLIKHRLCCFLCWTQFCSLLVLAIACTYDTVTLLIKFAHNHHFIYLFFFGGDCHDRTLWSTRLYILKSFEHIDVESKRIELIYIYIYIYWIVIKCWCGFFFWFSRGILLCW